MVRIVLPQHAVRGFHQENAQAVLQAMCQQARLVPETVQFNVTGCDCKLEFRGWGVKLSSPDSSSYAVPVFVGFGKDTAKGYLRLIEEGRAVPGMILLQRLSAALGSRIWEMPTAKEALPRSANSNPGPGPRPVPAATVLTIPAPPVTTPPAVPLAPSEPAVPQAPGTPPAKEIIDGGVDEVVGDAPLKTSFMRYFDDQVKLHTAVMALSMKWEVEVPFSFDEFAFTMGERDVGLTCDKQTLRSMIQRFTNPGYIKRLNTGSPARYALTEKGLAFAQGPTPSTSQNPQRTKKEKCKGTISSTPAASQPAISLAEQILKLKEKAMRLEEIRSKAQKLEESIRQLKTTGLDAEANNLGVEIEELRNRISAANERLQQIAREKQDISRMEAELEQLQRDAEDPALVEASEEVAKMKKLLG